MSLVHELIKELVGDNSVTAVYGGGFKPPTKGHLEVVQKALSDFPEIDKFIIYVGSGERNGITQAESLLIWDIYKNYLPEKVEIQPSKAPIGDILRYAKNNTEEIVYFIIGARAGNEDDIKDIALRTTGVEDKYPNIKVKTIETPDANISGTKAREAAKKSPEAFYQYLPSNLTDDEKIEIFSYIQDIVKEQLNENASYSKDIDIIEKCAQLTNYMREKGYNIDPVPAVEFVNGDTENARDFFGKTAYYDPNEQKIVLYTEGRHPKDIVRSYAHEMIHHIQNLEDRLGPITTQNTQEDDHLNNIEAEANLKGTMTFRNWTDSLQEDGQKISDKNMDNYKKDNNPKGVKDPFGLNAYARELARGLEEALTIGDKEVERIDKPTNNPEDAIVIYKDGTTEPYLDTLNEGRYDSISRQLASIALNAWKSDFKDGAKYGYFEDKITPEKYPTDLTFMFKALGKFVDGDYTHNGYSRSDGEVGVEYEIPKDAIPQIWEEVYMDLISTIRHEIEHQTQGGKNVKKGKGMASDQKLRQLIKKGGGDIVRYVTLPKEIESNVQGLYLKAKKWRRPYNEVADEYIRYFLKITEPADVSYVKNKWQEVAKKRNLPSLLNEGRYDTLVNRLSSIVFEAFKDIHDRGDKEGEFEFRVDHPDEEHDIPSEEFYFDLAGKVVITDDEYEVNGGANAGFDKQGNEITPLLSVQFKIPKNPDWQRVSFDIKDVVRHELEHLTQDGDNVKSGKQMDDDQTIRDLIDLDLLPKADYFRLPKEIDSMLQGLYFKAKKSKKPYIDVINDYLDTQPINAEERENILKIWRSRAKALSLPVFETKYKLGKVMREQEETTEQQYKIYCDMDGVLTDFDTQFKELSGGIAPSDYESKNGREAFWSLISQGGVGYWVGMPWMPNGKQLWEYISKYNPTILSAPSKENESRLGKRLWVRNNLSPKPKLILASAANKPNYSGRDKILIDDRPDTIANWNAKGGIGILFKSTAQVIEELKKLGL